jgi:hypothetical protein
MSGDNGMKKDFLEWFRLITPAGIAIVGWLMITNINQFKDSIFYRFDKLEKEICEIKLVFKEHSKDNVVNQLDTEHRLTFLEQVTGIYNGKTN